ncbi:C40 family peptidase [Mucilaginibacter calamicampi]|uniref:C40 family peptidase n=1 Tax=Mucilaginibacter calamicampi TaxID=1302352 RepID=A0ABW2YW40_9SPHI
MKQLLYICAVSILLYSCYGEDKPDFVYNAPISKQADTPLAKNTISLAPLKPDNAGYTTIATGNLTPVALIQYAETLKGVPYLYGSTDPAKGFDCSGFITYVFNHFNVAVPRQSVGFTYVNRHIDIKNAKTGDLILFTGTDSTVKVVGHMGILKIDPGKQITFLHSTSGKDDGVTETPLNAYYQGRYMHTIRIFRQNDR